MAQRPDAAGDAENRKEDDQEGAPPVAVMSYRIWRDKYGSDASVVGAGYQINGHSFIVIGVAPPGFFGDRLRN